MPVEFKDCWTSLFGNRRSYNGGPYNAYHSGLDFCGTTGTELYAPAAGIVVFAGPLTVRGNATVIDHGWGVYTAYDHQSEIFVKPGDRVEPGQLIGLGGDTGRTTGPHLHWEVWVGGVQVDPVDWLEKRYIPALHFRWLTPVYDAILKRGMREETLKRRLIAQAAIQAGHQVLDLGCGTGTLTIQIKQVHPEAEVTGLDGDPEVLGIAQAKARQAGIEIAWEKGLAYALPFEDNAFDSVLCSLMLHHLNGDQKCRAFREVLRVLRPGGEFHILDFGPPPHLIARLQAGVMRRLEETGDHFQGRLPSMLAEAGFTNAAQTAQVGSLFGPLSFYQGRKKDSQL